MNKKEKLALFLGMLSGDGCLSITSNREGYRQYPIQFYNNDKEKVELFDNLFYDLFGIHGNIHSRKRPNRKEIWEFKKLSVKITKELREIGFPEGVKRDILRIPYMIKNGTKKQKLAFIYGIIITDGSLKKNRGLMFHLGSKLFIKDLSLLISEFTGKIKPVREFTQRKIYKSYQLYLNKEEKELLLNKSPLGTMVLRQS